MLGCEACFPGADAAEHPIVWEAAGSMNDGMKWKVANCSDVASARRIFGALGRASASTGSVSSLHSVRIRRQSRPVCAYLGASLYPLPK